MHKVQQQVLDFHRVYSVPKLDKPAFPGIDRQNLRVDLIQEEFDEFCDALAEGDLVKAVDAIADLLYVTYGTAIEFGIDMEPVLDEVQRSNMSKLADDGTPILAPNGKVLKGPNFFEPDIEQVLEAQGWSSSQ
jgi:predicted HAD superfamily Cof-like phosphohydrolase